jgi:hypothetical protein
MIPQISSSLHYFPFYPTVLIVTSTVFNVPYSYFIESIPTIFTFSFTLPLPLVPVLPLAWPVLSSCAPLFWCLFVVQWDFCLNILSVNILCLSQSNPVHYSSPFSPILCCLTVFSMFSCVLFPHRFDVLHYYSWSFFPPSLISSTSPTFGSMFCIYFYVFIVLLVFVWGLYSTYERKYVTFGFLNLANFT